MAHLRARYNYPCPGCFPLAGFEVTTEGDLVAHLNKRTEELSSRLQHFVISDDEISLWRTAFG